MAHHHDHDHAEGNIRVAFFLNIGFALIELIGGLYTNSLAILSDALHDFGDSLSLGLSWYFQKISSKGRTKNFSYGYKRFSLLAAIINSVILVTGSIVIVTRAVPKLLHPEATDANGMLILAILGIVVNGFAVLRLQKGKSLNEKTVSLHLLEDVLGWVAILIGSIIMMYFDAPFIDPLLSIAIAIFVLVNVYKNLRKSIPILLQGIPEDVPVKKIKQEIKELPEIQDVHDLHAWTMDGQYHIFTIHVVLKKDQLLSELTALKQKVKSIVNTAGIDHATIEFENQNEDCTLEDC